MARLFPFRSDTSTTEGKPRVVDLEDEDADAVFSALSSTTARRIYIRLSDEPATPSDVAEAIDSSIQNVRYHLEKLEEAGLIEVVDTWYSSRGNEMSVYAPADGPLIVTADRSRAARLREALSRFLGGVGTLAGLSALVQVLTGAWSLPISSTGDGEDAVAEDEADMPGDETAADTPGDEDEADTPGDEQVDRHLDDPDADTGVDDIAPVEDSPTEFGPEAAETLSVAPGLLFFLGGLVVLLAVICWWYWRAY